MSVKKMQAKSRIVKPTAKQVKLAQLAAIVREHRIVKVGIFLIMIVICVIVSHGMDDLGLKVIGVKFIEVCTDVVCDRMAD